MPRLKLDQLRPIFRRYAEVDFAAASAHVYAEICRRLVDDDELLALASETLPGQPPPNLLFGAAHALLLSGAKHPLAAYYPDLTPDALPKEGAFPHFRDFCLGHGKQIRSLVASKRVQTNVLERCGLLLPAFAAAADALGSERLALIEIGASAGLNLLWHRYAYDYSNGVAWGHPLSLVQLSIEVRGGAPMPAIPPGLTPAYSAGVDLEPVDLQDGDDVLWQRALIWPDRPDRQERLSAAIDISRQERPTVVEGDACELLPDLVGDAPGDAALCVFASFSLYQFPEDAKQKLFAILRDTGRVRPTVFLQLDGTAGSPANASIDMTLFGTEAPSNRRLLRGHPHGVWLEWLARADL